MSTETPKTIIEIKQKIQSIVSKLMREPTTQITVEENTLIQQISKYKVANQEELTRLSKAFGDVVNPPQIEPGSGAS